MKRFKPAVVIVNVNEYSLWNKKLKQPAVVIADNENQSVQLNDGDILLTKPLSVDELIKAVERLI